MVDDRFRALLPGRIRDSLHSPGVQRNRRWRLRWMALADARAKDSARPSSKNDALAPLEGPRPPLTGSPPEPLAPAGAPKTPEPPRAAQPPRTSEAPRGPEPRAAVVQPKAPEPRQPAEPPRAAQPAVISLPPRAAQPSTTPQPPPPEQLAGPPPPPRSPSPPTLISAVPLPEQSPPEPESKNTLASPPRHPFPDELLDIARENPGGWVYDTAPEVGDTSKGTVMPELLRGAWRIDEHGSPTGEYVPNVYYGRLPTRTRRLPRVTLVALVAVVALIAAGVTLFLVLRSDHHHASASTGAPAAATSRVVGRGAGHAVRSHGARLVLLA
jgi:hypothetical protein